MRLVLLFPLLFAAPVCAQTVAGAWYADDEDGRTRLELRVDGAGNVTGSLAGPDGTAMRVQGKARGAQADCQAQLETDPSMSFSFRARAEGDGLVLELIDPSGQPMDRIQFRRDGAAPPGPGPGPAPVPNPPSQLATFAGEFQGDGLKVTLELAGDGWAGHIESDGQRMACKARNAGEGKIAGSFEASGATFQFEAELAGDALTLRSDGSTYRMKRTAGGSGPVPSPPVPSGGEKAKHPAGVEIDLPRGWTSAARERGVQLCPPGVPADDPQAVEGHLLVAETIKDPAITSPDHEGVGEYMDQFVGSMFPGIQRSGRTTLEKGPRGAIALMSWSGQVPAGKLEVRAWVAIVEGVGVALVSAASPEQMQVRAPEMRGVANTFRRCEAAPAGELAGKWVLNGWWRGGQNRFSGDSQTVVRLNPDGSASYSYLSYVSTPAGVVENKEEKSGSWSVSGGVLTTRWQDGSSEQCRYQLNGNQLTTEYDDGSRRVWQRGS